MFNPGAMVHRRIHRALTGGGSHGGGGHHSSGIKPLPGPPPFPAPDGTIWVLKYGKPKLIIPGGGLAKRIITRQLREKGILAPRGRTIAAPEPSSDGEVPLPAGPAGAVVSAGQGGIVSSGGGSTLPNYLPMPGYLEPGPDRDFPEPGGDESLINVPPPEDQLPDRSVYGAAHTPMMYATTATGYGPSYGDADEGSMFPATPDDDELYQRDSASLDELESADVYGGAFNDGLAGISDLLGGVADYWKQKWDQAVAYFEARVGEFMGLKEKLLKADAQLAAMQKKAQHSATVDEATAQQIQATAEKNRSLLDRQSELEDQVQSTMKKIGAVRSQDKASKAGGLGIIPIIIGAAIVGTVLTVAGAVYYHTQSVNEHLAQLDALKKKILTPAELAALNASYGGAGLFGDLFKGLGSTLLIAGGLYFAYQWYTHRRAG